MEIRERQEGKKLKQGAQVTSTPDADYFYFVAKDRCVCVRLRKNIRIPEDLTIEEYWLLERA